MNIYEMVVWIRQYDNTIGRAQTQIADFLMSQHLFQRIKSEDLFYMLKDIMAVVLVNAPYLSDDSGV